MAQRIGLVVGKFSPLHHGHEWLIEFAQANCDLLYIISYSNPEFRACDAWTRFRWLRTRFPEARLLVFSNRISYASQISVPVAGHTVPPNDAPDIIQQQFLRDILRRYLIKPDVMFSGEAYGKPCADFLGIDYMHFERVGSISGTLIRSNELPPQWCSPIVRADLVLRVAVLGPESSGKTTLCEQLAKKYGTVWVPEYGREYWEKHDGIRSVSELYHIAHEQYRRINSYAFLANRIMFCDTTTLTTAWYCKKMFDEPLFVSNERIDALILCSPSFPFVQDGTRNFEWVEEQWAYYAKYYASFPGPKVMVSGSVDQRIKQVSALAL